MAAGKYAHVIDKLPKLLGTEPKYQEKVDAVKDAMLHGDCDCIESGNEEKPKQHGMDPHAKNCNYYLNQVSFIPAHALVKAYADIRAELDELERKTSEANLRLEATAQLMDDRYEVEGTQSITLLGVGNVRQQVEPYAKVEDKDKFRWWCINVCQTCGDVAHAHTNESYHDHKPITLEDQLTLPWQSINSITKERLLAGLPEPKGVTVYAKSKFVLTRTK